MGAEFPKQYLPLAGRTVIEQALAPFLADARCQGIILALDAGDARFDSLPCALDARIRRVAGGARRCDSVRNAVAAIDDDEQAWVLVHDAARPCLAGADIDSLLAQVAQDPVGGLLAVPMADTIKRADDQARVLKTPPRSGLWRALTPQMFRLGVLGKALAAADAAGREPTDESQAVEWLGHSPLLVAGNPGNLKVTTAMDLDLAAAWLARENQA